MVKRVVHIWLEHDSSNIDPGEYIGFYNHYRIELSGLSLTSNNGSWVDKWENIAKKALKESGLPAREYTSGVRLFDNQYSPAYSVGFVPGYPTIYYLGCFEFEYSL